MLLVEIMTISAHNDQMFIANCAKVYWANHQDDSNVYAITVDPRLSEPLCSQVMMKFLISE